MKYLFYVLIIDTLFGCSTDKSSEVGINPLPNFDAMWDYQHPDSTEIVFIDLPVRFYFECFGIVFLCVCF